MRELWKLIGDPTKLGTVLVQDTPSILERMPLWQSIDAVSCNSFSLQGRVLGSPSSGTELTLRLITSMQNESESGWVPISGQTTNITSSSDVDFIFLADGLVIPFYRYIRWEVLQTAQATIGQPTVSLIGLGDHRG